MDYDSINRLSDTDIQKYYDELSQEENNGFLSYCGVTKCACRRNGVVGTCYHCDSSVFYVSCTGWGETRTGTSPFIFGNCSQLCSSIQGAYF